MSIVVISSNPNELVSAIKEKIDNSSIRTWTYDSEGDFSHSPDQWEYKAWFRPSVMDGKVVFKLIAPINKHLSVQTYGVYHGRFIEMLLSHFDRLFLSASASALPSNGDLVKGSAAP